MTMTDIEAKALALVNEVFMERCLVPDTYTNRAGNPYHEALCRTIERLEATEARHAAELREQAERFSEVAGKIDPVLAKITHWQGQDVAALRSDLAPFILPAPDPLVEAEKLISTLRSDEREGYAVAGQAAETISNLVAALRAQQKDTDA